MKPYRFHAFGLTIESEIDLDRLLPARADGRAEVFVSLHGVPTALEHPTLCAAGLEANAREVLFRVDGVADFYIRDGSHIAVSPRVSPAAPLLQAYLLGTCIGALLLQRGVLPLHGSCVCKDGQGLLIMGASGAGKSTLAMEFLSRGWKLVSDDVTPVTTREGVCRACPSYPSQKLWEDALGSHREAMDRKRGVIWESEGRAKYALDASALFHGEEVALRRIVVLMPVDGEALRVVPIGGLTEVDALMKGTYRPYLIADIPGKQAQFTRCVQIAQAVPMLYVERPQSQRTESEIARRVLAHFEEESSHEFIR